VRVGSGFDVHAFGPGTELTLGGVKIAYSHGLVAHSDGDVALHALCDALLGALALGDIGQHFPPSDERFRGADSRVLLRTVIDMIHARAYRLGNADLTIICESPRIGPHAQAMRERIADDCQVEIEAISVKATTTEKLGFTGRQEGVAAQAIVLLLPSF